MWVRTQRKSSAPQQGSQTLPNTAGWAWQAKIWKSCYNPGSPQTWPSSRKPGPWQEFLAWNYKQDHGTGLSNGPSAGQAPAARCSKSTSTEPSKETPLWLQESKHPWTVNNAQQTSMMRNKSASSQTRETKQDVGRRTAQFTQVTNPGADYTNAMTIPAQIIIPTPWQWLHKENTPTHLNTTIPQYHNKMHFKVPQKYRNFMVRPWLREASRGPLLTFYCLSKCRSWDKHLWRSTYIFRLCLFWKWTCDRVLYKCE